MKKLSRKILSVLLVIAMLVSTGSLMVNTNAADVSIPDDAVEFNGHCYKVYEDAMSWVNAKNACENVGGHLVTITSQQEQNFVWNLVKDYEEYGFWIGGTDAASEGKWTWVTGETWSYNNWYKNEPNNGVNSSGVSPEGAQNYLQFYGGARYNSEEHGYWDDFNDTRLVYICEWEPNIYNLGEDTYRFENYGDSDSKYGHCFGMSVTSSGYYLGLLKKNFGVNSDKDLYELADTAAVKEPICYYQGIQGSIRDQSMVAGGNGVATDWNDVINYVKNHNYDGKGSLVIGYGKINEGGHAVNFLRYEVVDGQERIYAYDNECPTKETYFYQDANGDIRQAVYSTFSGAIDNFICLMSVPSYLMLTSAKENMEKYKKMAIYADNSIIFNGATRYLMYGENAQGEHYVYEIPEDMTTVKITPLVDNASFSYMGQEYTFGEINDSTYAELKLSTNEEDVPEFEIFNDPVDEPSVPDVSDTPENTTKDCSCKCHGNAFMQFIHKILCFLYRIFGMEQYRYCGCGKAHW